MSVTVSPVVDPDGTVVGVSSISRDVSPYVTVVEELSRSQRSAAEAMSLLETTQNTAPVGLGFLNREFQFVRANQMLAAIHGSSIQELIGRTLAQVSPRVWQQVEPVYRRVIENGESFVSTEVTGEIAAEPGVLHHWVTSHYPVRVSEEIIGIGVVVVDITERKNAEMAHEALESRAHLLDAAGEAIIAPDANGLITYVNAAAERLYGWRGEDVVGRSFTETALSEEEARDVKGIMEELRSGRSWSSESLAKRADGSEFWAEVTDTPVFDHTGAFSAIIGVSTDVTDRRRAQEHLAADGRWFRTLVQGSSDVIAVLDSEAELIYANPAAERMLGLSAEEYVGRNMIDLVHPDDLEAVLEAFQRDLSEPGVHPPAIYRFQTRSDEWRFLEVTTTNCLDDPAIAGIVVNARDVTERTNLTRALRTISAVNEVLVHASDESSLLTDACAAITGIGGYVLAWIGRPSRTRPEPSGR